MKTQWFLIESDSDYALALARYQEVKNAPKNSDDHKEKLLLVHLISEYEKIGANLPEVDPIELIKIRMDDFGYKSADLAKEYGDKGTVSKVLNYKQALSLTMIRKFSRLLRIPVEALTHEYELR
ncbi:MULTISPECIES: type II toxin-antitoxin system HigA family antitoxin [Dyadobacter]|jgi:HTH-type transcriptional regulator/antitoxin HigA|uniref:XRE family transcriptional regulator n=1 Tax=Dyadobacter chenhuakuii TaxID=2909339 RepID=A0A9X1QCR2_9BACT|nr:MULTISPECIES: XRE family transcriptional regulator [Dyadobacter]MCE7072274.1 XRE family transcriptional regulator [Dyadobacter sp. CY327]MCF2494675.1 XRE family transcriptional regulator [Dyadobacter chenhuakuii]MCF2497419.1 XRE family transcriptional regulator [Dyadobacter chenhuakuii]MCF2519595.1 XRE family transcriptional regulator [Dyadobacter sp. CY351]USJ32003.1 XRE family transcriptional regulator [Dyadobacter chenhuakuii]